MSSHRTYEVREIVEGYARASHLLKPEQRVLEMLKDRLARMSMLDIGVGGGRTTLHFARLVNEYVGVDRSEQMIQACRTRFAGWPRHITFAFCDAATLPFRDASFDFVLFSLNGLDTVSHDGRLHALAEIRRVCRPHALFLFSSHNLHALPFHLSLRRCLSRDPRKAWAQIRHWQKLRQANPGARRLLQQPYGIFNDGEHDFGLRTYYIRPAEQVRQLEQHFEDIRAFRRFGEPIEDPSAFAGMRDDAWIYYLCRSRSRHEGSPKAADPVLRDRPADLHVRPVS